MRKRTNSTRIMRAEAGGQLSSLEHGEHNGAEE
jgi:hypothetical protein